jgi:integrase
MLSWAVRREYIDWAPFKRGSQTVIKKLRPDNKRRRRIRETEEAALLQPAPPHIQAMIITAIDTGMRQGEMLALRFGDIDLQDGLITLRGETTEEQEDSRRADCDGTTRCRVPMAAARRRGQSEVGCDTGIQQRGRRTVSSLTPHVGEHSPPGTRGPPQSGVPG